ncbi:hypothetical protein E4Z66_15140 [Aliishimia ponticola]|uniref:VPLPA-CTERM sorting domain-containing protein n=1 Tax=Aliishimia ponticola TaxID=2499833 RepID=A0A4S4N9T9_9RHOB|nr:VPLPA-CTERM sorting domain-containing protein [Aliishimia ponticola]THH35157.1 hypothetical protein E4Z66_15140 [Aliishimia ponticola]
MFLRVTRNTLAECAGVAPLSIVALLATASTTLAAPLTFDTMVGTANGSSVLGPVAVADTLLFTDVATENGRTIDARVTTSIKGDTEFGSTFNSSSANGFGDAGFLADYHNAVGGPEADLGFLYYGNGIDSDVDGISILFEFFDGTGTMSGSFTEAFTLSSAEIAIYDVDGEGYQSEFFSASKSDGLSSYAVGTSPQALVASDLGDDVLFTGPGTNYSELDATGAALLTFENTDSFTLDFGSVQNSGPDQNAVFSAIDGDVSLFDADDFGAPIDVTPVPLPAAAWTLASALGALFSLRTLPRRRRG